MKKTTGDERHSPDPELTTTLDRIELCEPDPSWPEKFVRERTLLQDSLRGLAIHIDHVGSTAVPGLKAKPIIDILVTVKRLDLKDVRTILEALGYVHVPIDEKGRLFFRKGVPRTHHLHLVEEGKERQKHLRFRDRLIAHPEDAAEYQSLKEELAARYAQDRDAYTRGKEDLIQDILGR